jgi:hypothetical protein
VPGIYGSDERHWQSLWRKSQPGATRIRPASWDEPELNDWLAALGRAIESKAEPQLIVAHSLGCLLVAFWALRFPARKIRGAFLAAPPDPENRNFPPAASSFQHPPTSPLPFPALVVASTNDPYCEIDAANRLARRWGAGFVNVGAVGHINSDSGLDDWPEGMRLLEAFRAGLGSFPRKLT